MATQVAGRPPYEPIEDEPQLWYGRFLKFCQLGPSRSVLTVVNAERHHKGTPEALAVPGCWKKASGRYRWVERARAWDARGATVAVEAREEVVRSDARAMARTEIRSLRRQEQEDAEWELRGLLLARAKEMAAAPLYRKKTTADGKTVIVEPAKWSLKTLAEFADTILKLGRASSCMPMRIEEDAAAEASDERFFETSGQLAQALPPGVVPEMPADVYVRPAIDTGKTEAGSNGAPAQPPKVRPP